MGLVPHGAYRNTSNPTIKGITRIAAVIQIDKDEESPSPEEEENISTSNCFTQ